MSGPDDARTSAAGDQGKHDPLDPEGSDCGLEAMATINTVNGLNMKVSRRAGASRAACQ